MAAISDGTTTIVPDLITEYGSQQAGRSIIHDIMESEAPSVSVRAAQLRTGTLAMFFADQADADACRILHARSAVFTLTPDADEVASIAMRYVIPESGRIRTEQPNLDVPDVWTVTVDYQEVGS